MRVPSLLRVGFGLLLLASAAQTLVACKTEDVRPKSGTGCHQTSTDSTTATKVN
jgi:hypothetical protein